ncbi:MAG: glycosyltransferase family 39 protein, partial [Methanobacteriota archaeon]
MTVLNYQSALKVLYREDFSWLFCLCCALFIVGTGLTFQAPWVDWDASDYINVAENIFDGRGIVSGWESDNIQAYWPLTVWPPFYPILIATFMVLGSSSVNAAMWIPILSFAGMVVLSFFIGRDLGSPIIGYLAALSCLFMSSFWEMARWAMTEMPYMFFSLLGLYLVMRYCEDKKPSILLLSAIFCGFGAITRYMGISLIITGILIIFFVSGKKNFSHLKNAFIFGFISFLPVGLVFLRNIYYKGHFSGADRGAGSGDIFGVLRDVVNVLGSDLNPFKSIFFFEPLRVMGTFSLIFALCIIGFMIYGVYVTDKAKFKSSL